MTSEEQAAWNLIEQAYNGRDSLGLPTLASLIAVALRTREAETWEQAAHHVSEYKVDESYLNSKLLGFMLRPSVRAVNEVLDLISGRLRARAAQPQEPTT